MSRETVELALNSHYSILIDSYHIRDQERRLYIGKCADDIKKVLIITLYTVHVHVYSEPLMKDPPQKVSTKDPPRMVSTKDPPQKVST